LKTVCLLDDLTTRAVAVVEIGQGRDGVLEPNGVRQGSDRGRSILQRIERRLRHRIQGEGAEEVTAGFHGRPPSQFQALVHQRSDFRFDPVLESAPALVRDTTGWVDGERDLALIRRLAKRSE